MAEAIRKQIGLLRGNPLCGGHTAELARSAALVAAGSAVMAFGIGVFIIPCNLVSGGGTGVALLVNHLTGVRVSTAVFVLNMAMLLWGLLVFGRKFAAGTLLSSVLYPLLLRVFESLPVLQGLCANRLLCAVLGGAFVGVGVGIVFCAGASTGGTDPVPLTLHKCTGLPVGVCVYLTDAVIVLLQGIFSDKTAVLYGVAFIAANCFLIDRVTKSAGSGHGQKQAQKA